MRGVITQQTEPNALANRDVYMWVGCAGVCEGIQSTTHNRVGVIAKTLMPESKVVSVA